MSPLLAGVTGLKHLLARRRIHAQVTATAILAEVGHGGVATRFCAESGGTRDDGETLLLGGVAKEKLQCEEEVGEVKTTLNVQAVE